MKHAPSDIDDNEIRIISPDSERQNHRSRRKPFFWIFTSIAVIAVALIVLAIWALSEIGNGMSDNRIPYDPQIQEYPSADSPATHSLLHPYTERRDTLAGDAELVVLTPRGTSPTLEIGNEVLADTTAVLVVQAADIRKDNGRIVGSFVIRGEMAGKGEAKAGFCSIIDGDMTIGVADATPMFEQALTKDGFFFRQYPLVVAGQIVENKPKGRSIRKALAETPDGIAVIMSKNRLTMHEFSQALVAAGVRNAISLVGGKSYGRYTDIDGVRTDMGPMWSDEVAALNYIVWR